MINQDTEFTAKACTGKDYEENLTFVTKFYGDDFNFQEFK